MNRKEFIKLVKFGLVGVLNTVIDFAVFNLFLFFKCPPAAAKGISYTVGMINSFFCNKGWTFRAQGNGKKQFLKFMGINLVTLLISVGLMQILSQLVAKLEFLTPYPLLSNNLANLMVIGMTLILNFIGSRWIVFKTKD